MKTNFTLLLLLIAVCFSANAQENEGAKATYFGTAISMQHVPSIASRTDLPSSTIKKQEMQDGRSTKNNVVPGKDAQTEDDFLATNPHRLSQKIQGKAPILVFDAAASNSQPTDPTAAVGPNHYFVVFNTGFIIYDKAGNDLTGQLGTGAIFPLSGCCDLTASYDNVADRWVLTFLGNGFQVAVSDGPDPVNDGWYTYNFPMSTDYQKLSVWSDGYYVTANKNSGSAGTSEVVFALERDEMLAGNPAAQIIGFPLPGIVTSGFYSPQAFSISDDTMPAAGDVPIVYLQDDAWGGVSEDHLKLWTIDVDWATPANSTISAPTELTTTAFISVFDGGSFSNLTQPGGGIAIDALQATIMNQAQFRKFSGHNSAVFTFVVDTDATGGELAGVRWYELRQSDDGQPWTIFQEGTYTSPDGKHAWHASIMMDINGNIGMGYTGMAGPTTPDPTTKRVASYYTGRYSADPLNTMTIAEELIAQGNANIPGLRYGDYSKIDIDPVDDKTFWFINEYMNSGRKDVVGVFKIAPNFNDDVGVVSIDAPVTGTLTAAEDVTVTIFNYGLNPASNFDVTYSVDGGPVVTETFTGTIASSTTEQFTFAATTDMSTVGQTYSITSETNMTGDEDTSNDATTKDVTHLEPNDIGVIAIVAPVSGTGLTATEDIIVTINNFGGASQSNFDVTYDLDGTVVTETVAGPLAGNTEMDYTFTQTGDFSALGTYNLSATTSLPGDIDTSNDETSVVIVKTNCEPHSNCTLGDGIRLFAVGTINNASGCEPDGYGDFTALSTDLEQNSTNDLTITTGYGDQFVRVWIDFNDDFVFGLDELVVDNYEIADGEGAGTYTETMPLVVPAGATLGQHLMRAKTNWNAPVPNDPCEETTYGETEDYMANIVEVLAMGDPVSNETDLMIVNKGDNIFDVSLTTPNFTEDMLLTVYNVLGQRMVYHTLKNIEGAYNYELNMSYVASGVYLVRVGNDVTGKVKKIVVE